MDDREFTKTEIARAELATARIAVSDWHSCQTADELGRWRAAIDRLITAAIVFANLASKDGD